VPSTETVEKKGPARLPSNVIWLSVVSFLNDFSSEMIYPLLPLFFTTVLGAGPAALGAMEGLVESAASLVKLYSGRLGDRLPRRKPLVVAGYSLASITRPLLALAMAPWQVIGLRVVDRVGKGLRGAPRDALIADSVDSAHRGRAFGFHRAMDHLGAIAGPVTALVLIPLLFGPGRLRPVEYRVLFAIAAVPALLSILVLLLLVHEAPRHDGRRRDQPAPARLSGAFWYLLAVIMLFTLGNSSDTFLLLRANHVGLGARSLYLIWALLHVVKSALSTPAGILSDRVPRRWLIAGGWLVYAAVYFGFGRAGAAWQIWWLFAIYGLYFGLVEGCERALVADLVPATARGTAFGYYNAAIGIMALPASALFGLLWSWRGPATAFDFGGALALVAAVLLLAGTPIASRPLGDH
jgi:MFS family permease